MSLPAPPTPLRRSLAAAAMLASAAAIAQTGGAGRWSPPVPTPLVPVAASNLPDGRVLLWSAYDRFDYGGDRGMTYTAIFDPATGAVTERLVSETGHDMFCPGTANLADGRLMVAGGSSSTKTSFYDPATGLWSVGPEMNIGRGYQGNATLSDGSVFTIGGSWSGPRGGKVGEVWTADVGWRLLDGIPASVILTHDAGGVFRQDNHAWLFAWNGTRVFHAGPSRAMHWFDTAGVGSSEAAGPRGADGDAMNGNATMFDIGRLLTTGGSPSYVESAATASAHVIDLRTSPVTVRPVGPMAWPRAFHNSVVLPDGRVLVVGGQPWPVPFTDTDAVLTPELWSPATGTFTPMAPMQVPRTYHSVALLLADGRVLVGGGGLCGTCATNHADVEIFTPPYLLAADGTEAPRPVLLQAPTTAARGAKVVVRTDREVSSFVLMRAASATHSVNNEQRRVPVKSRLSGTLRYTLTLPTATGTLVPGDHLLFALDATSVPSVAKVVRITP